MAAKNLVSIVDLDGIGWQKCDLTFIGWLVSSIESVNLNIRLNLQIYSFFYGKFPYKYKKKAIKYCFHFEHYKSFFSKNISNILDHNCWSSMFIVLWVCQFLNSTKNRNVVAANEPTNELKFYNSYSYTCIIIRHHCHFFAAFF